LLLNNVLSNGHAKLSEFVAICKYGKNV